MGPPCGALQMRDVAVNCVWFVCSFHSLALRFLNIHKHAHIPHINEYCAECSAQVNVPTLTYTHTVNRYARCDQLAQ